jgi:predicted NAD/FAD-dependent oxidoreductase
VEASERIGGRVRTQSSPDGKSWESGCEFLTQPPVNPLVQIAEQFGIGVNRTWMPPAEIWTLEGPVDSPVSDRIRLAIEDAESLVPDLVESSEDAAFADLIDPASVVFQTALAVSGAEKVIDPGATSILDLAARGSFEGEWPLAQPMSTLIDQLAANLPIRLSTEGRVIDWGGETVRIDLGNEITSCRTVIVTCSTGVLQSGQLHFAPDLPESHTRAITSLSMNRLVKAAAHPTSPVSTRVDRSVLVLDTPIGAVRATLQTDHVPAIRLSSCPADDLDASQVEPAFLEIIERVFGITELAWLEIVDWREHAYSRGGWATTTVGNASSRLTLAEPLADKLWFAGEATSRRSWGTAHGAWNAGIKAASEIAFALGRTSDPGVVGDTDDDIFRHPF